MDPKKNSGADRHDVATIRRVESERVDVTVGPKGRLVVPSSFAVDSGSAGAVLLARVEADRLVLESRRGRPGVSKPRSVVLDASALLAMLHVESGAEAVEPLVETSAVSTVNCSLNGRSD